MPKADLQSLHSWDGGEFRLNFVDQTNPSKSVAIQITEVHSHRDNLLDTRLRDVLRQSPQSLQVSLSIDDAHDTIHPIDLARFTRVVPAVLRSWKRVIVEQDSDSVFPGPGDRFGEVPICQL
jgi:hypothetical protein